MDDKGLAAGTSGLSIQRGTVTPFKVSALQPDGPKDPFQQLRANDEVLSLAVLDDKELAAGTDSGTADLFSVSALQPDGPRYPSQQLQPSGDVHFSAVLDDERLAAGTDSDSGTADFCNLSASQPNGPENEVYIKPGFSWDGHLSIYSCYKNPQVCPRGGRGQCAAGRSNASIACQDCEADKTWEDDGTCVARGNPNQVLVWLSSIALFIVTCLVYVVCATPHSIQPMSHTLLLVSLLATQVIQCCSSRA